MRGVKHYSYTAKIMICFAGPQMPSSNLSRYSDYFFAPPQAVLPIAQQEIPRHDTNMAHLGTLLPFQTGNGSIHHRVDSGCFLYLL